MVCDFRKQNGSNKNWMNNASNAIKLSYMQHSTFVTNNLRNIEVGRIMTSSNKKATAIILKQNLQMQINNDNQLGARIKKTESINVWKSLCCNRQLFTWNHLFQLSNAWIKLQNKRNKRSIIPQIKVTRNFYICQIRTMFEYIYEYIYILYMYILYVYIYNIYILMII